MRKLIFLTVVFLIVLSSSALAAPRAELLRLTNTERVNQGISRLILDREVSQYARQHSIDMANQGAIFHTPDLTAPLKNVEWSVAGENVGTGYSILAIHKAFMNSPSHRANILMTNYDHVAIGTYKDAAGVYWVTVIFYG